MDTTARNKVFSFLVSIFPVFSTSMFPQNRGRVFSLTTLTIPSFSWVFRNLLKALTPFYGLLPCRSWRCLSSSEAAFVRRQNLHHLPHGFLSLPYRIRKEPPTTLLLWDTG